MTTASTTPVSSLYVHVPFCAQKCHYCAFYSEASSGEVVNRYVSSLVIELEGVAHDLRPRTVFFGGGTPSLLNLRQWETVFRAFERLNLLGAQEWTVECNPATVSLDKARLWRSYGINRVSMGVQSLDEALLGRLGRVHDRGMVFRSFDILRQAGFESVNLDLMFAIPGQTADVWRQTLREALAMGSEHLSCYEVIYEEDTALYAQLKAGQFEVDEELACTMYDALTDEAGGQGLEEYEIANFARGGDSESRRGIFGEAGAPGFACRHNLNYWRGGSFYGLGPSAAGLVRGLRTRSVSSTARYCEALERRETPWDFTERLSPLGQAGETAAFGLRMTAGWNFEEFKAITGHDLRREWVRDMDELVLHGWAERSTEGFRLSRRGLRFADAAAESFLRL